jgi:hypothetical protein
MPPCNLSTSLRVYVFVSVHMSILLCFYLMLAFPSRKEFWNMLVTILVQMNSVHVCVCTCISQIMCVCVCACPCGLHISVLSITRRVYD